MEVILVMRAQDEIQNNPTMKITIDAFTQNVLKAINQRRNIVTRITS